MTGLFALLAGCAPPPEPVPWSTEDVRPDLSAVAAWNLPDLSLYAECVEGPADERPTVRQRGAFGVGNGRAFGLVGLADPLNTLHGATGPTYDADGRFFADVGLGLEADGEPVAFDVEWAARPRGTGVVVTRADGAGQSLYTLDFAPRSADAPAWIVRRVVVTSDRDATVRLVRVQARAPREEQGLWIDDTGARWRVDVPLGAAWEHEGAAWTLDLGTVGPDQPATVDLVWVTTGPGDLGPAVAAAEGADVDALLAETLGAWAADAARGTRIEAADPRWGDLLDGLRAGIAVQTADDGGISPMSRYTLQWMRDTYGAVRFLARAGLVEEAQAALDALHACHAAHGDYANSCARAPAGDEPDWAALPPFDGREAAEGPSHVPLAWEAVATWSGDPGPLEARWDYLARGVLAQRIDAEGRQPWSGDETFRLAMGASLGYPLEYDWPGLAWSANSDWLAIAAARALARRAEGAGRDPAAFEARADLAQTGLDGTFLQPDGHWAAIAFHTAGPSNDVGVDPRPYEDASLMPLWLGVLSPDEAWDDFQALYAQAGHGDGTLVTPLDPSYQDVLGLDVRQGVLTGMEPGYALWALSALGHPEADDAFAALHRFVDPAGQASEGLALDDGAPLQVIYDPTAALEDVVARYRPWEGGVLGDALLFHLIGAAPVDGGLALAPHLPGDQPWLGATDVRAGPYRLDLSVERDRKGLVATVTARTPLVVEVSLATDPDRPVHAGERVVLPGGEIRVRFDPVALEAGETAVFRSR